MVRVRVNAAWSDWKPGDVVEVERTRLVDGMIRNEYLTVLDDDVPDEYTPQEFLGSLPDVFVHNLDDVALAYDKPQEPWTVEVGETGSAGKGELTVAAVAVPPKTGKGSGVDAWREFLGSQNIPFEGDASKADLIALWDDVAAKRFG